MMDAISAAGAGIFEHRGVSLAARLARYTLCASIASCYVILGVPLGRLSPSAVTPLLASGCRSASWAWIVAAMALLVCWSYRRLCVRSRTTQLLVMTALYAASLAVGWVGPAGPEALHSCSAVLLALGFGLLAARLCPDPRAAIALLATLVTVRAVWAIAQAPDPILLGGSPAGGILDDPVALACMMAVFLPLALLLAYESRGTAGMAFWSLAAALMFSATLLTRSHVGLAAAVAAVAFLPFRLARRFRLVAAAGAAAAVGVVGILQSAWLPPESDAQRPQAAVAALASDLRIFSLNWAMGVGPGQLGAPASAMSEPAYPARFDLAHPHTEFGIFLGELGVSGGALLLLLLRGVVGRLARTRSPCSIALGAAWIAVLTSSLLDIPFGSASRLPGTAIVGALLGLTMAVPVDSVEDGVGDRPTPRMTPVILASGTGIRRRVAASGPRRYFRRCYQTLCRQMPC